MGKKEGLIEIWTLFLSIGHLQKFCCGRGELFYKKLPKLLMCLQTEGDSSTWNLIEVNLNLLMIEYSVFLSPD